MGQYFRAVIGHKEDDKFVIDSYLASYDYNDNGAKLMEHSYIGNSFVSAVENLLSNSTGKCLVWAGDYAKEEADTGKTLYMMCVDDNYPRIKGIHGMMFDFAINHTKKQYVNLSTLRKYGSRIHPVPLLCAEGNGNGGGDYYGSNKGYVGLWARDEISFVNELPEGYTEIKPNFRER